MSQYYSLPHLIPEWLLPHEQSPGISSETCLCTRGFCGKGWVQYMNACYKVEKKPKNWNEAEMACQRYGTHAHLASIHSTEENDFIFHLMGKPLDRLNGEAYWIGGHDTFKEGTFVWTDGSRFDFQSFFPTEPNGLPGEHYLGSWYLQNGHITWNDYPIQMKFPSVCKYYLANGMYRDSTGPKQR
uniref:C-type lectin domain-containing protein n=1 Tax=Anolis carolinensis TaxID=28377 RepID=A0A803TJ68_ANOCA|nr:PREDICTED: lectin [Anolis carolinensis]|eukprot:XP_008108948.1 PREDICTED: lectin [Anolis carolinensis]